LARAFDAATARSHSRDAGFTSVLDHALEEGAAAER
jgi:hypothetical protein